MLQSGSYGCVYRPKLNCDGRVSQNKATRDNFVTKLQADNHVARNEHRIAQMVRRIPNYELHFLPAESMCTVETKGNLEHLRQCAPANRGESESKRFVLLTLPYKRGDGVVRYITNKATQKREKLSLIFDVYTTLLSSIELLVAHRLVHFDLHSDNVHFHVDSGVPLLIDFGMSIALDEPTEHDCRVFGPEVEWWCLDISLLALWQRQQDQGQRQRDQDQDQDQDQPLYDFMDAHVPEGHFLHRLLTPDEVEAYKASGAAQIKRHQAMTKEASMAALWAGWETWDNFSVSVILLTLLGALFEDRWRENAIVEAFVQLLLANVDPDPQKRHSIAETRRQFDQLFYTVEDPQAYLEMINLFQGGA